VVQTSEEAVLGLLLKKSKCDQITWDLSILTAVRQMKPDIIHIASVNTLIYAAHMLLLDIE
jgi:hypothetical protein